MNENSIFDNLIGIYLQDCKFGVLIEQNNISTNTEQGIYLLRASYIIIQKNNFIGNMRHASFSNSLYNKWSHNYWDDWDGSDSYRISGSIIFNYSWFQFDRYPLQVPYDIGG
jgi:parallel beta-helix repeat protein